MDDELHRPPPDLTAALDQAKELLLHVASVCRELFLALKGEGFTDSEALKLTCEYLRELA